MGGSARRSWRKTAVLLAVSLVLTGLGFAVRYAEDNQIGETNEVSWWVFVAAGVFAYWAALGLAVSMFNVVARRGGKDRVRRSAGVDEVRRRSGREGHRSAGDGVGKFQPDGVQ